MEDSEIAECVQEVGLKIANVMNKDLEQIKDVKEIERISSGCRYFTFGSWCSIR